MTQYRGKVLCLILFLLAASFHQKLFNVSLVYKNILSDTNEQQVEVPQGSILSPILFGINLVHSKHMAGYTFIAHPFLFTSVRGAMTFEPLKNSSPVLDY